MSLLAPIPKRRLRQKTKPASTLGPIPRRRLRQKTKPVELQQPVFALDLGEEALEDSKRMAYTITFAHPKRIRTEQGKLLVPPSAFAKEEMIKKVLIASLTRTHTTPRRISPSAVPCIAWVFGGSGATRCKVARSIYTTTCRCLAPGALAICQ